MLLAALAAVLLAPFYAGMWLYHTHATCALLHVTVATCALLHVTVATCALLHVTVATCALLHVTVAACALLHVNVATCALLHVTVGALGEPGFPAAAPDPVCYGASWDVSCRCPVLATMLLAYSYVQSATCALRSAALGRAVLATAYAQGLQAAPVLACGCLCLW